MIEIFDIKTEITLIINDINDEIIGLIITRDKLKKLLKNL